LLCFAICFLCPSQVDQVRQVTPEALRTTTVAERRLAFETLAKHGIELPSENQAALIGVEATAIRASSEANLDFKPLVSIMRPYPREGSTKAFDPNMPLVADMTNCRAATKNGWFMKVVFEECMVEYILQGVDGEDKAIRLARAVLSLLEADLESLSEEASVKLASNAVQISRVVLAVHQPTLDCLQHARDDFEEVLNRARLSTTKAAVAQALRASPFWEAKVARFQDLHAAAAKYFSDIENGTDMLHEIGSALAIDMAQPTMKTLQEQSKKLCIYQQEFQELIGEFENLVLEKARVAYAWFQRLMEEKSPQLAPLLQSMQQCFSEVSNAFPLREDVATMFDKIANTVCELSQGRHMDVYITACKALAAANAEDEEGLKNALATFLASHNEVTKTAKASASEVSSAQLECYPAVIKGICADFTSEISSTLFQAGWGLQSSLGPQGLACDEVTALDIVAKLSAKLEQWEGREVKEIVEHDMASEEGEFDLPLIRATQHLAAKLGEASKLCAATKSECAKRLVESVGGSARDKIEASCAIILQKTKAEADEASENLVPASSVRPDGSDWMLGLPAKPSWPKFLAHASPVFKDVNLEELEAKRAKLEKAIRGLLWVGCM
jgi:hypothetical protein